MLDVSTMTSYLDFLNKLTLWFDVWFHFIVDVALQLRNPPTKPLSPSSILDT